MKPGTLAEIKTVQTENNPGSWERTVSAAASAAAVAAYSFIQLNGVDFGKMENSEDSVPNDQRHFITSILIMAPERLQFAVTGAFALISCSTVLFCLSANTAFSL